MKSIFIIYNDDEGSGGTEFRNIYEVDGKPIRDSERRAQRFFEQLTSERSTGSDREKLRKESVRHDLAFIASGLTQYQSPILEARVRPYFSFTNLGTEERNGRRLYRIAFEQRGECPYIAVNRKPAAAQRSLSLAYELGFPDFLDFRERLPGILLLDAETFQIVREERKLTISPEGFSGPVTLAENVFEYQACKFGIMTPKTITHVQYSVSLKDRTSVKRGGVRFEYSDFSRPDVQVKTGTAR